jgi:hypothetical protein
MLLIHFALLLQLAAGAMTRETPQNGTGIAPEATQAFAKSLQLSSDDEIRVVEILTGSPDFNSTANTANIEKRAPPSLLKAGCQISRVAFGENALLEEPAIKQAISESWCVTLLVH